MDKAIGLIAVAAVAYTFHKFYTWHKQPDLNAVDTFRLLCWFVATNLLGVWVIVEIAASLSHKGWHPLLCSGGGFAFAWTWVSNNYALLRDHVERQFALTERIVKRRKELDDKR